VTALPEIVGEAGVMFDPTDPGSIGDAITRLIVEPEEAGLRVRLGFDRVRRFSWTRTAEETLQVYARGVGVSGR